MEIKCRQIFWFRKLAVFVVVYTYLSGKQLHRQTCTGRVVTSGTVGGELVNTLAQNVRDVALIPALGTIFSIFITPTITG